LVVSECFLERADAEVLRVRQYSPIAGGKVDCTVTVDDDLLVGRLAAELSNAGRVDFSFFVTRRARNNVFGDSLPCRPARAAAANVLLMNLLAVDEQGDRLIGAYMFNPGGHGRKPGLR